MENILFGHRKGAYTGAETNEQGLFQKANGGTLFLDEIGDLPTPLQSKLLKVLDDFAVYRLGSNKGEPLYIRRIIFATNQPLRQLVDTGQFRRDLYHRINPFEITIPPLRERIEDIPPLIEYLLDELNDTEKTRFSPQAMEKLKQNSWPGNVRELKNVLIRCVPLQSREEITLEEIGKFIQGSHDHVMLDEHSATDEFQELLDLPYNEYVKSCTSLYFSKLIERYGRNTSLLAEKSGMSKRYIQKTIKKFNL